jgi:hypothetical protein
MLANRSSSADLSAPFGFNLAAQTQWCPRTGLISDAVNCTQSSTYSPVVFPLETGETSVSLTSGGGITGYFGLVSVSTIGYTDQIDRILQFLHAAVRLDIGYNLPNNLLTNASLIPAPTVWPGGQLGSRLGNGIQYPFAAIDGASINAIYQCNYKVRKSWPEVILAVFVATFALFNTGWGAVMFAASFLARRKDTHESLKESHLLNKNTSEAEEADVFLRRISDLGSRAPSPHGNFADRDNAVPQEKREQ